MQQILPSVIDSMYRLNRDAHLPPRGMRGYSITGVASVNYLASAHEEPLNDPLWTLGMCPHRSSSLRDSMDLSFAFPGLDGRKGLIIRPTKQYIWLWKGAINVHGGICSTKTKDAVENPKTAYKHLTMGLYQKQKPLNFGHRFLKKPRNAEVFYANLNRQNEPNALSWMV